jgi:hypothetical protein
VRVFITIDTELWPRSSGWPHVPLSPDQHCEREQACYFWGGEARKKLGLPFQLETFSRNALKATFFVDPLFSFSLGLQPLQQVISAIKESGQEIGLHLHPEWLTDPRCAGLPTFAGPLLSHYSERDQIALVRAGRERLAQAGAHDVCAFRAGSWAANLVTLRALAMNGIRFDTSLNPCYPVSFPDLPQRQAWIQPDALEGVWEFPVTFFFDRPPTGTRPLHICACSLGEFEMVLEHAYRQQWFAIVIVTHSFELMRVAALDRAGSVVGPHRLLGRRFEKLCRYLGNNRDRFVTSHFRDVDGLRPPVVASCVAPAKSNYPRTLARYVSQLVSIVY